MHIKAQYHLPTDDCILKMIRRMKFDILNT